jgi:predicted transcriptional regulator
MPATTIKLSPDLRERVAAVARREGTTAHAFLVRAVEHQTTLAEKRLSFVADALAAEAEALRTGKGFAAEEVHAYLKARLDGKKAPRPRQRAWRK